MLKPLLIPDYFNGHHLLKLMVKTFDSLAEGPTAQTVDYFESKADVVMYHYVIVASVVIVPVVVRLRWRTIDLLSVGRPNKVN